MCFCQHLCVCVCVCEMKPADLTFFTYVCLDLDAQCDMNFVCAQMDQNGHIVPMAQLMLLGESTKKMSRLYITTKSKDKNHSVFFIFIIIVTFISSQLSIFPIQIPIIVI